MAQFNNGESGLDVRTKINAAIAVVDDLPSNYAAIGHTHGRSDMPVGVMARRSAWDASSGSFPGGGTVVNGDRYRVSVAGTVDGIAFEVGDYLLAVSDNASTTTFSGNWEREAAGPGSYATAAQGALADTSVQPADIADHVKSDTTQAGGGTQILNTVEITQAAYDALGTPDANTLYVING